MADCARSSAVLALIASFVLVRSVAAMDVTVTRFDDPPPSGCTVANCSLREAVILTNAFAGPDRIFLPAGTYTLSIVGANEEAAQTGDLDITDAVTIIGAGSATTTVGWSLGFDRVFEVFDAPIDGPERQVTFSGLTIKQGAAPSGSGSTNKLGGGLSARGDRLFVKLADVVFDSNSASAGLGGGAYFALQHLQISASRFTHNTALRGGGAAIFMEGATLSMVGVTADTNSAGRCGGLELNMQTFVPNVAYDIRNLVVTENVADNDGGGLCIGSFTRGTTVHQATITNNQAGNTGANAGHGGGVLLKAVSPDAATGGMTIVFDSSLIAGNHANGHGGGVLFGEDIGHSAGFPCSLTLLNTHVTDNHAVGTGATNGNGGGGLYAIPAIGGCQVAVAAGSSIDHNTADGGGGGILFSDTGTLDVVDSTIEANTTQRLGGGLHVTQGQTTITRSSVIANSAGMYGGGIEVFGPLLVDTSTFDGNTAPQGPTIDSNSKPITVLASTIVGPTPMPVDGVFLDITTSAVRPTFERSILVGRCHDTLPIANNRVIESPGGTCNLGGSSIDNVSAAQLALGPLANNGGATRTHMPQTGSAAIARILAFDCLNLDQRGLVRTAPCDVGSVETDGLDDVIFRDGFQFF